MGVYIEGMEMPKNCYKCRMVDSCQYLWEPYGLDDYSDLQDMIEEGFTRADNCPLVEVPPNGRLIEKNAVFKLIQSMPSVDKLMPVEFMKALQEIPTVIPAEEDEECTKT